MKIQPWPAYNLTEEQEVNGVTESVLVGFVGIARPNDSADPADNYARLHDYTAGKTYRWNGDLSTQQQQDDFVAAQQDVPHANWIEE